MYIILFYDIADKTKKSKDNSRAIRKLIEKYLTRVQLSVFEGEIRPSDLKSLKADLKKLADEMLDSIIIYEFKKLTYSKREVIGIEKSGGIFS